MKMLRMRARESIIKTDASVVFSSIAALEEFCAGIWRIADLYDFND
jgi:hypothetical protein